MFNTPPPTRRVLNSATGASAKSIVGVRRIRTAIIVASGAT
jgi:hypothetical protein